MPLPTFPTEAVALLAALNGGVFDSIANPYGMDDGGHIPNWPPAMNEMAEVANYFSALGTYLQALADQVSLDAGSAEAGSGTEASIATIRAVADVAHYVSMRRIAEANKLVAITFASPSTSWDMAAGINRELILEGNTTLANPTNQAEGKTGLLVIKQDATGGRAITSWGSNFAWFGGQPTWPVTPNAETLISYMVRASGKIYLNWGGNTAS